MQQPAGLLRFTTLLAVFVTLVVAGCSENAAHASTSPARKFIVCGIDRSRSYDNLLEKGKRLCAQTILQAEPGSEVLVRWISDLSYALEANAIGHYRIPDAERCQDNPFDKRCARVAQGIEVKKRQWAGEILALEAKLVNRTDIYGFFAKAGDIMREAPPGSELHIIAATDLADNVRFSAPPDHLKGVHIRIYGLESDDPMAVSRTRDAWTEYFARNGALSVSFPTAEVNR